MSRSKKPTEARDDQTDQLPAAVQQLADQVGLLTTVLDEFRSDFRWAIRNDKLRCPEAPAAQPPATATIELDEHQLEAMTNAVTGSVQDLAGDVEGAVRDGLKEEFADFRESVLHRHAARGPENPSETGGATCCCAGDSSGRDR